MDDALLVGGLQSLGDLLRDRQRLVEREAAPGDPVGERSPSTSSRTSARGVVLDPVDRGDVRMIERREHLRLAWKRARRSGSSAKASGSTLIATSRFSLVSLARSDLAHTARRRGRRVLVMAETGVGLSVISGCVGL